MDRGIDKTQRDRDSRIGNATEVSEILGESELEKGSGKIEHHGSLCIEGLEEDPDSSWRYVRGQGFRRYHNALKSFLPIRREKKKKAAHLLDDAGLFSFVLFSWMSKFMYKTYKKGFDHEEWPSLSPYEGCDRNTNRLEAMWNDELARHGEENASFTKTMWRFIRTRYILEAVILVCSTLCGLVSQMLLMNTLLESIGNLEASWKEDMKWVTLFVIGEIIRVVLLLGAGAVAYRTAVRLKLACMGLLYRKIIRLSHLENTSIGKLTNILVIDSHRLVDMIIFAAFVPSSFLTIFCGLWMVLRMIGPMASIGILTIVFFLPLQYGLSCLVGYIHGKTLTFTDARIRLSSEILKSIDLIKMHRWEKHFSENIYDVRKKEQRLIFNSNFCSSLNNILSSTIPNIATIVTFLAHIATGATLTAAQAFPVSGFFSNQMMMSLMYMRSAYNFIRESLVATRRLKKVLMMKEASCTVREPVNKTEAIAIRGGTFGYIASRSGEQEESRRGCKKERNVRESLGERGEGTELNPVPTTVDVLFDVTLEVPKGKLVGICGPVGSGKSSLLLAMLGQLQAAEGTVARRGSCAYVAQQPWIINATLRDNVLFGEPYDAERYSTAMRLCELIYDLDMLPGGDLTEIGERGATLSGGQKQRIALARAVYANRDIYFLDDSLNAVDAHVGLHIFDNLITGVLQDKTVLFVTQRIQYLMLCDHIYTMRDGRIADHGTHESLLKTNHAYAAMAESESAAKADTQENDGFYGNVEPVRNSDNAYSTTVHANGRSDDSTTRRIYGIENHRALKAKAKLVEAEKREKGALRAKTYLFYAKAAGGWLTVLLVLFLTLINVVSDSFSSWWLANWLNAGGGIKIDPATNATTVSDNINDHPDFSMYQAVYAASLGLILLTSLIRSFVFCKVCIGASSNLHNNVFNKIMNSPMKFFETTPIGRIQNLFTKDMDTIDVTLPDAIDTTLRLSFVFFISIILTCIVLPWAILPLVIPIVCYYIFANICSEARKDSVQACQPCAEENGSEGHVVAHGCSERENRIVTRNLMRMEHTTRGSILSHVTATIHGLDTINAFEKRRDFEKKFNELVEHNNSYLYLSCGAMNWIMYRVSSITIATSAVIAILVVVLKGTIPSATAGLVLTQSMLIAFVIQSFVESFIRTETNFVSIERMKQYIEIPDVEGDNGKRAMKVKPNWPKMGTLKFEKVCMSYRKDLPLALNEISIAIRPREKIGIVGRTGSGKTSLVVALYRLVELSSGKITLDDVDVSEVGLDELRGQLSIIPQDPVLFSGTIRSNVDPFKTRGDTEIWAALERVDLKERIRSIDGRLDANVDCDRDSWRIGERVRLWLAKALLRHAKILLLDEATAATDPATEAVLRNTIRQEFADTTVLMIAHKLRTVLTCDRILLMDQGQVAEFDTPENLLADDNSRFSRMMAAHEMAANR